jgi:tetratricopeptide (TPR) repeat protein
MDMEYLLANYHQRITIVINYIEKYYLNYLNNYQDSNIMFELGKYYFEIGKTDDMVKYYHLASELNHPIACFYLGEYYSKQNDEENMLKYYFKSAELQYNPALNNLGLYYSKEKEYEKAKQVLRNKIDKKYMDQIKELSELKNSLFREADKCKRCHGDGTITYRACAEADREEAECPDCKGTGKYL